MRVVTLAELESVWEYSNRAAEGYMSSKREHFYAEVERMKPYYRRFTTKRLLRTAQVSGSIKPYLAAVKAVLKERESSGKTSA